MWQINRHHILQNNMPDIQKGDIVNVEHEEWWGFTHRRDIVLWLLKWS